VLANVPVRDRGAIHGGEPPVAGAGGEGDSAGLAGVKDGYVSAGKLVNQPVAGTMERGVMDDDDAGLDGVEKGFAKRLAGEIAIIGKSGDEDIGAELVGAGEEGVLADAAKIGEKEDARAVEVAEENDGVVVGARRRHGGVGVQGGPGAEMAAEFEGGLRREIGPDEISDGAIIG